MLKFTVTQSTPHDREDVIRVFERSSLSPAPWIDGLEAREQIEGDGYGELAVARLTFDTGSSCTYITETVLRNRLPESITLSLDAEGLRHESTWAFREQISEGEDDGGPKRSTIISIEHRIRFAGMNGLLTLLFRKSFVERAQQELNGFLHTVILESTP